mgnify:CR=1 FL=1
MAKTYSLKRPFKKARKRMKLMGLDPQIFYTKDEGILIIPLEQLVSLIDKKVTIPTKEFKKEVFIEENRLIVRVYRCQK